MSREDLRNLYQDVLVDHSHERHGYGLLEDPTAESHGINRSCGDEITLHIRAGDGVVESIGWTGQGCAISQASASMLSDIVAGLTRDECTRCLDGFRSMLQSRGTDDGDEELLGDAVALSGVSLYPPRINCAMLAWTALEDGLSRIDA
ncbi:SUF system NifU family Fe-S cluster assembly protein [Leifsonia bigeumensis]|uniref:SUF system NifU family Fe-S cluster assembly protein n=1 Tax=Leifsonella bigeumensis TaxID=433643 RepID=A0ABP7FGI3_9MICO